MEWNDKVKWGGVPEYMRAGVERYVVLGIPPGHFLSALFKNDFMEMARRADDENMRAFPEYAKLLYNQCPAGCFGSEQNFKDWVECGGTQRRGVGVRLSRVITAKNRTILVGMLEAATLGAQVEIVDDPRTTQQNRLMWGLLNDIADQLTHCGEKWEPEDYKCAFMKAMGVKLRFMPALDGDGVVAIGYRSSKLDKDEFSELIERIYEYGARNGVVFHGEAA